MHTRVTLTESTQLFLGVLESRDVFPVPEELVGFVLEGPHDRLLADQLLVEALAYTTQTPRSLSMCLTHTSYSRFNAYTFTVYIL